MQIRFFDRKTRNMFYLDTPEWCMGSFRFVRGTTYELRYVYFDGYREPSYISKEDVYKDLD